MKKRNRKEESLEDFFRIEEGVYILLYSISDETFLPIYINAAEKALVLKEIRRLLRKRLKKFKFRILSMPENRREFIKKLLSFIFTRFKKALAQDGRLYKDRDFIREAIRFLQDFARNLYPSQRAEIKCVGMLLIEGSIINSSKPIVIIFHTYSRPRISYEMDHEIRYSLEQFLNQREEIIPLQPLFSISPFNSTDIISYVIIAEVKGEIMLYFFSRSRSQMIQQYFGIPEIIPYTSRVRIVVRNVLNRGYADLRFDDLKTLVRDLLERELVISIINGVPRIIETSSRRDYIIERCHIGLKTYEASEINSFKKALIRIASGYDIIRSQYPEILDYMKENFQVYDDIDRIGIYKYHNLVGEIPKLFDPRLNILTLLVNDIIKPTHNLIEYVFSHIMNPKRPLYLLHIEHQVASEPIGILDTLRLLNKVQANNSNEELKNFISKIAEILRKTYSEELRKILKIVIANLLKLYFQGTSLSNLFAAAEAYYSNELRSLYSIFVPEYSYPLDIDYKSPRILEDGVEKAAEKILHQIQPSGSIIIIGIEKNTKIAPIKIGKTIDENDIERLQNILSTKLSDYLIQVYPLPIEDRCIIIIIAMKPWFSELSLLTGIARLYK